MTQLYTTPVRVFIWIVLHILGNNAQLHSILPNQVLGHRESVPYAIHDLDYNNKQTINSYNHGPYSTVCWNKIITTVENLVGKILDDETEYEITFEFPTIVDNNIKELENHRNSHINPNIPIERIRKAGNKIIREKKYMSCKSGPWYKRTNVEYTNNKKILHIRVSPEKNLFNIIPNIDELREIVSNLKDAPSAVQNIFDAIDSSENEPSLIDLIKKLVGDQMPTNLEDLNSLLMDELCEDGTVDDNFDIKSAIQDYLNKNKTNLKSLIKYQDQNGVNHCFYDIEYNLQPTNCPEDISNIPELPTSEYNRLPKKYLDPFGRDNPLMFPGYNPSNNIVKHTDENGQEHCYYKFSTYLEQLNCPRDTSRIPELPLSEFNRLPVKYPYAGGDSSLFPGYKPLNNIVKHTDENGQEHCYYKFATYLEQLICPRDTSRIPELPLSDINRLPVKYLDPSLSPGHNPLNNIVKHTDENGQEHCYYKFATYLRQLNCPRDTSRIPELPLSEFNRFPVKYIDPSLFPGHNPLNNIVKHTDENGQEHCYHKFATYLVQLNCPRDTSRIPELPLSEYNRLPVKYLDPSLSQGQNPLNNIVKYTDENGQEHCYYKFATYLEQLKCPRDTSHIPELPLSEYNRLPVKYLDPSLSSGHNPLNNIVKHTDENGQEHCYYKFATYLVQLHCPRDTSRIPEIPLSEYNRLPVKYLDPSLLPGYNPLTNIVKHTDENGQEHCYYKFATYLGQLNCPRDTSRIPELPLSEFNRLPVKYLDPSLLPGYNPLNNIVKQTDENGQEHCYYKFVTYLEQLNCPRDTSRIPELPLSEFNRLPVKYLDPYATDPSLFPGHNPLNNIVKHTDENGQEHCYYKFATYFEQLNCPRDTSRIPELPLSEFNRLPVKYLDPYATDPSLFPGHNPLNNIVKHTDENGQEHCYYKFVTYLEQLNCPRDTSRIPELPLSEFNRLPVKYLDPYATDPSLFPGHNPLNSIVKHTDENGQEHCYYKFATYLEQLSCPRDTSRIPELPLSEFNRLPVKYLDPYATDPSLFPGHNPLNNIVKHTDENGQEHCYYKFATYLEQLNCPRDTSRIPELPLSEFNRLPVKYLDPYATDPSLFPGHNPLNNIVKHTDENGQEHCYYKFVTYLEQLNCPRDTSGIPELPLSEFNRLPVKYLDPYATDPSLFPGHNPLNNIVKHTDENGQEHCYYKFATYLEQLNCPRDTSRIPELPLSEFNRLPVKYLDPYATYPSLFPGHNPLNNIVKHTDENGQEHCYYKFATYLEQLNCPRDTSRIPELPLSEYNRLPVKYLDPSLLPGYNPLNNIVKHTDENGQEHCYYKFATYLEQLICPRDTSRIPELPLSEFNRLPVKYLDPYATDPSLFPGHNPLNYIVKHTDENGQEHCYYKFATYLEQLNCPRDTSRIPELPLSEFNRLPVKYLDPYATDPSLFPGHNPLNYIVKHTDENGQEHCYYKFATYLEQLNCPRDISRIPELPLSEYNRLPVKYRDPYATDPSLFPGHNPLNNIVKHTDENGQEHCYYKFATYLEQLNCPKDTSRIPELPLSEFNRLPVKYLDPYTTDPSLFPGHNPLNNIVKHTDENGQEHCYYKFATYLEQLNCPRDTSRIPELPLSEYNRLPVKYLDPSLLSGYNPLNNIVKHTDEDGQEHCYYKFATYLEQLNCLRDTSRIPELPLSEYNRLPVKYLDPSLLPGYDPLNNIVKHTDEDGQEHCYYKFATYLEQLNCPRDTSRIPELTLSEYNRLPVKYLDPSLLTGYNPLNNIVKHTDEDGQEHCYYKFATYLEQLNCPRDTSRIPELTLFEFNRLPVQYLDPYATNTSLFPGHNPLNNIVKHTDENGQEHCYYKFATYLEQLNCPRDTSRIPELPLSEFNRLPVKYLDPYATDPSLFPGHNPLNNIVKHTDENGQEHCYYKFATYLEQLNCPRDTSRIPELPLSEFNRLPVKYLDPYATDPSLFPGHIPLNNIVKHTDENDQEHCYYKFTTYLKQLKCPRDTSHIPELPLSEFNRLPVKYLDPSLSPGHNPLNNIVKHTDENGQEHCYYKFTTYLRQLNCPRDTSLIPELPLSEFNRLPVKYLDPSLSPGYNPLNNIVKHTDENGQEHCYYKFTTYLRQLNCPRDTSHIPELPLSEFNRLPVKYLDPYATDPSLFPGHNPLNNIVKHTDENGQEHCYYKFVTYLEQLNCPRDTSRIPELPLSEFNRLPVKYLDPYATDPSLFPGHIPLNNIVKHTDENGQEHCYYKFTTYLRQLNCPRDTSHIPELPLSEFNRLPVKYLDPSLSPGHNPLNNIVKHTDENGQEHCYYKFATYLEQLNCPRDTSRIPELPLSEYNRLPVKYLDPSLLPGYNPLNNIVKHTDENGQEHCYYKFVTYLEQLNCPRETSRIPELPLSAFNRLPVKYLDSYATDPSLFPGHNPLNNIVKHTDENGQEHCYYKFETYLEQLNCPRDTSRIPELPLSEYNRLPVKYIDPSLLPGYNPLNNIVKHTDEDGQEHCYYKFATYLEQLNCPRDTSRIPELPLSEFNRLPVKYLDPYATDPSLFPGHNPLNNIVKHTDENGQEHCYCKFATHLEQWHCPIDTARIPELPLSEFNRLPVKYLDRSLLPGYNPLNNIVKHTDENGQEHCYYKFATYLEQLHCPIDTSRIPELPLSEFNRLPVKYLDPSLLPGYNPINNIVKHTDEDGQEHCYYKFATYLEQLNCPRDTSRIPELPLSEFNRLPINYLESSPVRNLLKYTDDNGQVHCYYKSGNEFEKTICPEDTSNIPEMSKADADRLPIMNIDPFGGGDALNNIGKYIDDNGQEHCYDMVRKPLQQVACPEDTSNIPEISLSDDIRLPVKYVDPNGGIHCYVLNIHGTVKTPCPIDTSTLPVYNPLKNIAHEFGNGNLSPLILLTKQLPYLAKTIDSEGNEKCFFVHKTFMDNVKCPLGTSILPSAPIHKLSYIGKIGNIITGFKCVEVNGHVRKPVDCPYDTNILPQLESETPGDKPGHILLSPKDLKMLSNLVCKKKLLFSLPSQ